MQRGCAECPHLVRQRRRRPAFLLAVGIVHTVELRRARVVAVEFDAFCRDGVILLPGRDPGAAGPAGSHPTGIHCLEAVLRHAHEHPERQLCVTGHAGGDTAAERSRARAASVLHLLAGEREAWAAASARGQRIEDVQEILRWANGSGGRSLSAADLGADGRADPAAWAAIFDLYDRALAARFGPGDPDLPALRAALRCWTDGRPRPAPAPAPTPTPRPATPSRDRPGRPLGHPHIVTHERNQFAPYQLTLWAGRPASVSKSDLEPINPHHLGPDGQWKPLWQGHEINVPRSYVEPLRARTDQELRIVEDEEPPAPPPAPAGDPRAIGCVDHHLILPHVGGRRRAAERRAEVCFFAPGEEPAGVCGDQPCTTASCQLYDPEEYDFDYADPEVAPAWIEIELRDGEAPRAGEWVRVMSPGGRLRERRLDLEGVARFDDLEEGVCRVWFPDRDPPPAPAEQPTWLDLALYDARGCAIAEEPFAVTDAGGVVREGTLDALGVRRVEGLAPGPCQVRFPGRGDGIVPGHGDRAERRDTWPAATGRLTRFELRGADGALLLVDEGGAPVAGAAVELSGPAKASGVSDGAGRVELRDLAAGRYWVEIRKSGFHDRVAELDVDDRGGAALAGELDESAAGGEADAAIGQPAAPVVRRLFQLKVPLSAPCAPPRWAPIRALEADASGSDRFDFRTCDAPPRFSLFFPGAALAAPTVNKVHVFFSAGGVRGDLLNSVTCHGLRLAHATTDWILIAVEGDDVRGNPITQQEIHDLLARHGRPARIDALRLSAHSRGYFGLAMTIQGRLLPLDRIQRVVSLDADGNKIGPAFAAVGLDLGLLFGIQATVVQGWSIPATRTCQLIHEMPRAATELTRAGTRALCYARIIEDARQLRPELFAAARPPFSAAVEANLRALQLPPLGKFSTRDPAPAGMTSFKRWCLDRRAPIEALVGNEVRGNARSDLCNFVTFHNPPPGHDLPRLGQDFGPGILHHHLFAADFVHEVLDPDPPQVG